jgi:hypothetical protein
MEDYKLRDLRASHTLGWSCLCFFWQLSQKKKGGRKKIVKGHRTRIMQPLLGERKSSGAARKVAATVAVGVALVLAGIVTSR